MTAEIEVGEKHPKPNVPWCLFWDEGRTLWVIHRADNVGGICLARAIRFETHPLPLEVISKGRALYLTGELLVRGMTRMEGDGSLVACDLARFRYCRPSKQSVAVAPIACGSKVRKPGG